MHHRQSAVQNVESILVSIQASVPALVSGCDNQSRHIQQALQILLLFSHRCFVRFVRKRQIGIRRGRLLTPSF